MPYGQARRKRVNLLVGNMVRDINIKIHQEVKPSSQITMRTRAKE